MISWKEAKNLAANQRPDLDEIGQIEAAKEIFFQKNIIESFIPSVILSGVAIILSLVALLK